MSQGEEQARPLPQPAAPSPNSSLLPAPDYDKVFRKFHQHTLSDSTNTTASNDSSPTTTISTVDDSSATEPSPGSSPESPPPTTFAVGMLRPRTADDSRGTFFELQKDPPPRKGRNFKNLKNLAVNTSINPGRAASTPSLPLPAQQDVKPSVLSPSFVKPPTPPRRRPSNLGLTILTPGGSKPPPQEVRLNIPPTPGFKRIGSLRHFQSSPSLPLAHGFDLPHSNHEQSLQQQPPLDTIFSPIELKNEPQIEEEEEQNFEIPLSREEKPEAYPDGPICVYDPSIDLYLEPTAEEARRYDVVLNVASEVRNPLVIHDEPASTEPDLRLDGGGGIQYAPKRLHLSSVNAQPSTRDSSPTTPKATPLDTNFLRDDLTRLIAKDPEYIHVPWEHNSDIVPDLLRLVKLIDEKVNQGKRVLVHCQCGVSRSASLVVAFGLYKNPTMSVQEAYDAVKKRSKWIGPNMNLIMQLQEFRSSLARGGVLSGNRALSPLTPSSAVSDWRGPFSNDPARSSVQEDPLSAALPSSTQGDAPSDSAIVSPGPSSAPSEFAWPLDSKQRSRATSAVRSPVAYVDPSGHVVPVVKVMDASAGYTRPAALQEAAPGNHATLDLTRPAVGSPRSTEFAMAPLRPSEAADPADSFGIMSPSTTEFATNPFDRSALLASLGMGSMRADEETPRRSLSLRNRETAQERPTDRHLAAQPTRRLRGKVSSPTLREQQQLQSWQAKIEATLPVRVTPQPSITMDDALMSPRATEFTNNPFALPGAPTVTDETQAGARERGADPRSPAHKGASPITRNILDVL